MTAEHNVATVGQLYGAFGRGDLPTVLQLAHDDVAWVVLGPTEVPWYGVRQGKEAVGEYFASLAQHMNIRAFEPREMIAQGDNVAVVLHIAYVLQHNACAVSQDQVHVWTFRDGKIARFQDFQETASVAAAWRGV